MSRRLSVSLQQHVHQEKERLVRALSATERRGLDPKVCHAQWDAHVENLRQLLSQAPETDEGRAYRSAEERWIAERLEDMRIAAKADDCFEKYRNEVEFYARFVDSARRSGNPDEVRDRIRALTNVVIARAPLLRRAGGGEELLASVQQRVSDAVVASAELVERVDEDAARIQETVARARELLHNEREADELAIVQLESARLAVKVLIDEPGHAAVPSCMDALRAFVRLEEEMIERVGEARIQKVAALDADAWWVLFAADRYTERDMSLRQLLAEATKQEQRESDGEDADVVDVDSGDDY